MDSNNLSLLDTKGFVVLPQFLSPTEIKFLKQDFQQSKKIDSITNYNFTYASVTGLKVVYKKIKETLKLVNSQTSVDADLMIPRAMYFHNKVSPQNFYHQDYELFYLLQQNIHQLNFWIPLTKENPSTSGLTVVPMDALLECSSKVINNGASQYFPENNLTKVENHNTGISYTLPIDISTIEISPMLNEGDALVMRGDLIHKTQDCTLDRLAISIRCTKKDAPIDKDTFLSGCEKKQKFLKGMPGIADLLLSKYNEQKTDKITAGEFYKELLEQYGLFR